MAEGLTHLAAALTTMLNSAGFVAGVDALSVTVTVKVNVFAIVGVPDSEPFEASARPFGNAPEVIAQVKGGEPPLTTLNAKAAYGLLTTPAGGDTALTTIGESLIFTLTGTVPVRDGLEESVTLIVIG